MILNVQHIPGAAFQPDAIRLKGPSQISKWLSCFAWWETILNNF